MIGHEQAAAEIVSDPVGHISISGVHGRDELNDRLARARDVDPVGTSPSSVPVLLIGVALGVGLALVLGRVRHAR